MKLNEIVIGLRPRTHWEAADLGVRLVQANLASVWRCYLPVFLVVCLVAAGLSFAFIEYSPWLSVGVMFWLKPWLDRSILFALSRAVFGKPSRFADLWRERNTVLFGDLVRTLTIARCSPWRGFTQPIGQLERVSGAAHGKRVEQLARGQGGGAAALQFAFSHIEWILVMTPTLFLIMVMQGIYSFSHDWQGLELLLPYGLAVLCLEPFFVAGGFCMYLNRRIQIEAWDVEREFRRAFP